MKLKIIVILIIASLLLVSCQQKASNNNEITKNTTENTLEETITDEDVETKVDEVVVEEEISELVQGWIDQYNIEPLVHNKDVPNTIGDVISEYGEREDFLSIDATNIDLSHYDYGNRYFKYNTQTVWPEIIDANFNPIELIEERKNPGLGLKELHSKGITGKGVNIGFIDTKLLVNHESFRDNLAYYEEIESVPGQAHFHGTMTLSILTGKASGVAPEANIYYFAYNPSAERDYKLQIAEGINKIIAINETKPEGEKIKVISLSSGWMMDESPEYLVLDEALNSAYENNILVFSAATYITHNYHIGGVERNWNKDPEDPEAYYIDNNFMLSPSANEENIHVLVPWYGNTVASPTGSKEYALYGYGAYSPAIPYYVGLYSLACQVNSDFDMEYFWNYLIETGHEVKENRLLINPEGFINMVKENKK